MLMPLAITRPVSEALTRCELTHLSRSPIDVQLARAQHRAYEDALTAVGCTLLRAEPAPELPDAVFVEDAAVVFDEVAVITRPGAVSRRAETAAVADALRPYRSLEFITQPATLDGGDVLTMGRDVFVGVSSRTNAAAVEQLRALLGPRSYTVHPVAVTGCLHLKSAVTALADDRLLVNGAWVDRRQFAGFGWIDVDPLEPAAANIARAGGALIYPDAFPRTRKRIERAGFNVRTVDVSELAKAEGAVTCCSLIFEAVR
jgi:dimethylargininase